MVDQQQPASQDIGRRLASCLEQVLSALVGGATVVFRDVKGADVLAALSGPVLGLTFGLSRSVDGSGSLILPGPAGLALAKMVLGEESASAPQTPGPEEEDALRELTNQVGGAVASTLSAILKGPVLAEAPVVAWLPNGGRELPAAADSLVVVLGITAGTLADTAHLRLPRTAFPSEAAATAVLTLPSLPEGGGRKNGGGMDMLLDISLALTVELGRARMMIRDILHLAPGSILELDKLASEPVDILINDKSIARGEVVVIDDKFGIRLTAIVTPSERVVNLR
jgi:flagellar motor switch protein FliN/FliY